MKNEPATAEKRSLVPTAVEHHQAGLLRYATQLMRGDAVRGREVVAATFAHLEGQPVDEVEDILPEWLYGECRRRAVRLAPRDAGADRREPEGNGATPADDGAEMEDPVTTMRRLFERLTPKQQEALRLHFQDGFGVKDIAFITDLATPSAGTLIHNAFIRLARDFRSQRPPTDAPDPHLESASDPRLTLFALGELEDRERRGFEASLIDRKAASLRIDALRAAGDVIGRALSNDAAGISRPAGRRKKRNSRNGVAVWFQFPRVLILVGIIIAIGVAMFFAFRTGSDETASAQSDVDFRMKAAPWPENSANAPEGQSHGAGEGSGTAPDHSPMKSAIHPGPSRSSTVKAGAILPETPAATTATPASAEAESGPTGDADDSEPLSTGPSATARGAFGAVSAETRPAVASGENGNVSRDDESRVEPEESTETQSHAPANAPPEATSATSHSPASKAAPVVGDDHAAKDKTARPQLPEAELPGDVDARGVLDLKRALALGVAPARDAVRIEQMLNYFPYAYAPPEVPNDFGAALEVSAAPWAHDHLLARVAIKARDLPPPVRPSANVVLLIDTSGSMAAPNRLPLVKEAARLLLGRLRPDDRVGIVTYAGESRLSLPPTPVAESRKIRTVLDRLEAGGMTNGGAGLELAYELAAAHVVKDGPNFVILCTDGDFNVGPTSESALSEFIDRWAKTPVRLSIFGFGRNGRIDPRLETLALRGRGGSGYVNTQREAEQILAGQLNGLLNPVARDLGVRVVFNPATVLQYYLLGYETPAGASAADRNFVRSTPAILPGQSLTALFEIEPVPGSAAAGELLTLRLNYRRGDETAYRQQSFPLVRSAGVFRDASRDFRFAAAVAGLGLVLENAPRAGGLSLDQVDAWGRESLGDDAGGYRSEFLALIDQARQLRR
ncbi:MAG TPA: von Willebrand factor type A domain-containing protein [Candidatus Didemnitutus sp.]